VWGCSWVHEFCKTIFKHLLNLEVLLDTYPPPRGSCHLTTSVGHRPLKTSGVTTWSTSWSGPPDNLPSEINKYKYTGQLQIHRTTSVGQDQSLTSSRGLQLPEKGDRQGPKYRGKPGNSKKNKEKNRSCFKPQYFRFKRKIQKARAISVDWQRVRVKC